MPEAAYLITAVALVATLAGVWLTAIPEVGRRLIPFSGLLLVLLTLFWVYPELAQREGFVASAGMLLMAVGVLAAMDRFVVPICPACSHTH
ncbi:MAG TPA: hypothetical protein VE621_22675, partial [Bryobacteraceae bacterium]|nr:hypothetical protein [Bryobacteraceae bacterium]